MRYSNWCSLAWRLANSLCCFVSALTPFKKLKLDLSDYPDEAFVEQLIYDPCHGCTISYNGPQFSYLVKNLVSTSQQPKVIDATLAQECELG